MDVKRTFRRNAAQIPLARRFVRETLVGWGIHQDGAPVLDDLVLMTSELFTNAVLHGAGEVEVRLNVTSDAVRLTVSDQGTHQMPRALPAPRLDTITGRGLQIVDHLASVWGSGRNAQGGTQVWLEVPRADPDQPSVRGPGGRPGSEPV